MFVAMTVLGAVAPPVVDDTSPSPVHPTPSFGAVGATASPPLYSPAPVYTAVPSMPLPAKPPLLVTSALTAADPNGIWRVYLAYPGFVVGTTPWAQQMDDEIFADVQARASQWEAGPASLPQASGQRNTLVGACVEELLTPALASFTETWSDDSSPNGVALGVKTLNYDLGTGQQLDLSQIFIDPQTALALISSYVQGHLSDMLGPDFDASIAIPGTNPTPDNYDNWAITQSGIKITFGQNQVQFRADPLPQIVVPWSTLRPVMAPAGLVAQMTGP
jgi:hypothetical protein